MCKLKILWHVQTIVWILILPAAVAAADMTSTSYTNSSAVLSGGGAPATSESYRINSTVGQSTPLMDWQDPPFSDNFDLFPGFWYTVAAMGGFCPGDDDGDKDVDGLDIKAYAVGAMTIGLDVVAADFGRTDCR